MAHPAHPGTTALLNVDIRSRHLLFSHDMSITRIIKKHVFLLFDRHNLFPVSFGNMFLNDLVIGEEEIIKSFITIGNVPSQNSALFDHSHELLESLRYNRSWKHSG